VLEKYDSKTEHDWKIYGMRKVYKTQIQQKILKG
jgi:hypothetical protein